MIRSCCFLALVCTSLGAGNAKCAPGDASCPGLGDEEVLLQSKMIHEVDEEQKQLLNQGEEEDAEDDEEDATPGCRFLLTPNACAQDMYCVWFDGKCLSGCGDFKSKVDCPARCGWDKRSSTCTERGAAGLVKGTAAKAVIGKAIGGPGSDLIFSLPLVISNVTKFSTRVEQAQGGSTTAKMSTRKYVFGNPAADKAKLLSMVEGFWTKLLADPHAKAAGVTKKCPKGDWTVIKRCVESALCLVQDHLTRSTQAKMRFMKIYTMLETLSAQFSDIAWPLIISALKHEDAVFFEGYSGEFVRTHTASFLEASAIKCSKGQDLLQEDDGEDLLQEDDGESTAVRAAAYHTSAVLEAAAKATHAILDAHTHNSSEATDTTVEALRQAWKSPCELLNCDHKNYYDMWGASHSHSLALIEAGASAQHMRTQIRIRHRLEVRMQYFLGKHPEFGPRLNNFNTKTQARVNHYTSTLRPHLLSFAERHAATKTEDELMILIGSESMKEFVEGSLEEDGGSFTNAIAPEKETVEAAMQEWEDANDDGEQELSQLEEESEDEEEEDHRGGKGSRRRIRNRAKRRISRAVRRVGKGIRRGVNAAVRWVKMNFNCLGQFATMQSTGYAMTVPDPTTCCLGVGVGFTIGLARGYTSTQIWQFMKNAKPRIQMFVSIVIGTVWFTKVSPGLSTGVGVVGGIGCSGGGSCNAVISVASVVSPKWNLGPLFSIGLCFTGMFLGGFFGCMSSIGGAVTIYCCKYDFFTKKSDC